MTAMAAFGTTLGIGDGGGPETFTTIAQVRTSSGPGLSADTIEVSHHESTGGWRTFVAGMKDGGEVGLDLLFDPVAATHKDASGGLLDLLDSGAENNFELTFSDTASTTWTFAGLVTGFEPTAPYDGELTASVSIKVTGQPTLA